MFASHRAQARPQPGYVAACCRQSSLVWTSPSPGQQTAGLLLFVSGAFDAKLDFCGRFSSPENCRSLKQFTSDWIATGRAGRRWGVCGACETVSRRFWTVDLFFDVLSKKGNRLAAARALQRNPFSYKIRCVYWTTDTFSALPEGLKLLLNRYLFVIARGQVSTARLCLDPDHRSLFANCSFHLFSRTTDALLRLRSDTRAAKAAYFLRKAKIFAVAIVLIAIEAPAWQRR